MAIKVLYSINNIYKTRYTLIKIYNIIKLPGKKIQKIKTKEGRVGYERKGS